MKIDYTIPELESYLEKSKVFYAEIDSTISILEKEIKANKEELENTKETDVQSIKRKIYLQREIPALEKILEQKKAERPIIGGKKFSVIRSMYGELYGKYKRYINEQLISEEEEVNKLIEKVEDKIKAMREVEIQSNATFNKEVVAVVNNLVGKTDRYGATLPLSSERSVFTKTLEERVKKDATQTF